MEKAAPDERVDRFLCAHFREWPSHVQPLTADDRIRCVRAWLSDGCGPHHATALALIACVGAVLDELHARISSREQSRLFYRIDVENLSKTPDSILDKMMRGWDPDRPTQPAVSFGNYLDQLRDLARFRIVANFLSDVETIQSELTAAFGNGVLTAAQRSLRDGFVLEDNAFEDCTHLLPAARDKGERCFKACLWPKGKPGLRVEVQVMTILEEAWDKKDHFLIYEPRRRGDHIDRRSEIEMFAMSELLYVADLTFDRLKKQILDGAGGDDATAE